MNTSPYSQLPIIELLNIIQQRPHLDLATLRFEMIRLLTNDDVRPLILKLITYNILRSNDVPSWSGIIDILSAELPDIIGLQEVDPRFFDLISQRAEITATYDFVRPNYYQNTPGSDAELLLIRREYGAIFYEPAILPETSNQNRHTLIAKFTLDHQGKSIPIIVGTCHLESFFFSDASTQIKCSQLTYISEVMRLIDPHATHLIFGDMNLTGGPQLNRENACIDKLGLTDVWKRLHVTSEDENDPLYQQNDITWDGRNNQKVPYREFHRPDRIFLRTPGTVTPISIERIINSLSDHYGLRASFYFNE